MLAGQCVSHVTFMCDSTGQNSFLVVVGKVIDYRFPTPGRGARADVSYQSWSAGCRSIEVVAAQPDGTKPRAATSFEQAGSRGALTLHSIGERP